MKLHELARRLSCRLEGDGDADIERLAGIEQAGPGDLTFFANPRYAAALRRTRATAVVLGEDAPSAPCAMLRTREPYLAFANALSFFITPSAPPPGVRCAESAIAAMRCWAQTSQSARSWSSAAARNRRPHGHLGDDDR